MSNWIKCSEKLPDAGLDVIAYFINEFGRRRRIKAFYAPKFAIEVDSEDDNYIEYDEKGNAYLHEGWYEENEFEAQHWFVTATITHWHLLPAYPEDEEALSQMGNN